VNRPGAVRRGLRDSGILCLITDRHRLAPELHGSASLDRLVALVRVASRAGVDLVQVRERDLAGRELRRLVARCVDAVSGTACRIVVNDRADVALAARAHGVHLRADSLDADLVRTLDPEWLIGRSVHSAPEARVAGGSPALDYLVLGTMFATSSKPGLEQPAGLDALDQLAGEARVPVLAVGGITLDRVASLVARNVSGVAGIGLFIPPRGVSDAAHFRTIVPALRRLFDTSGGGP